MTLTKEILKEYNQNRKTPNKESFCNAPALNMYLNSWGSIGACWLSLEKAPKYPDFSLRDIWFGRFFQDLRSDIKSLELRDGCKICEKRINDKVFHQVLAKAYDISFPIQKYPQVMEFELSNLCNLACVMCKGSLSSKIRKDRENLDAFKSPYDENFVEQLKEFLPHLKEARFNGGEPFLQQICWKIWDAIAEINPEIEITVATNGTLLTEKIKSVMEKCRFRVNVSLDSLIAERYESIRVGSNFRTVTENLKWYRDYCLRKQTNLAIMVNPMRINWEEMPKYVEWCSENHYHLWFNTIWRPRHLAIWTLPSQKISEILDYYRNYNFNPPNDLKCRDFFEANLWAFKSFAFNQVQGWLKDQIEREDSKTDFNSILKSMEGSKEIFSQRHVYLENSKYFEKLEILTSKVLSQDRLYFYLNKQSEFTLKAKMQDPNQNQVLEWVYQICDYY